MPLRRQVGDEGMSLLELADKVQVEPSELVRTLFMKGITLSMNQVWMGCGVCEHQQVWMAGGAGLY